LRVTLGGGGTDLPSYYQTYEGFLIAGAIDKYVYITVNTPFRDGIFLKYSRLEEAASAPEVKHPIIREVLSLPKLGRPKVEITSLTDIPAGTGLGSSGSFTTALLKAMYAHCRLRLSPAETAELACHIEIDRLGEPVGKQDQYIASYGGLTCFTFRRDDTVLAEPLATGERIFYELEDRLLLFFTGFSRSAASILKDQDSRSREKDGRMLDNLHYVKDLGLRSRAALEKGDIPGFALLLREHWEHKKRRSQGMSNPEIDAWYELGMANGAAGGKLVGAGGGGFLMFLAEDAARLRQAMRGAGLQEVRFRFDLEGTRIVL
jgi:D-glycero-alpha-D-manno-heptose-7-phosphate kinase